MGNHLVLTPVNPLVLPKFDIVSAFRPRDNQVPMRPMAAVCLLNGIWESNMGIPIQTI